MKTLVNLVIGMLVGISCICKAQSISSQPIQVTVPAPTPYAITGQDANSRVWQRMDYTISPSGEIITNLHSVTEVCSGLNHLVNGKWVESSEQIDILPNGTAVATNGQHQVYFPGDIAQGTIKLVTPDGQNLVSQPLGLFYFDGANTVEIAELTNSVGLVSGDNQVIYPNAFAGLTADLRYNYTRSGFEQDIIIRQQPPTPESLGLNPDTTRLQVMTVFINPPQPAIQTTTLPSQAGLSLQDQTLSFGTMQMTPGRAFLLGQNATEAGAMVSKHWVTVNGLQLLIEEVPVDAIIEGLAALPMTAMNTVKHPMMAIKDFKLPVRRASKGEARMTVAKAEEPAKGFLMDYQTLNSSQTNYTFQGDTTYYISGTVNLYQTSTFEGNAVLKFATNGSINIAAGSAQKVIWAGGAYRPLIFTAVDDNSVGDSVSTNTPSGYYGNPMLSFGNSVPTPTINGLRVNYAKTAIQNVLENANIYNAQFVNCQNGLSVGGAFVFIGNALFVNTPTNFIMLNDGNAGINAQNITFSGSKYLVSGPTSQQGCAITLTNCILANVTNLQAGILISTNGNYNGLYNSQYYSWLGSHTFTNTFNPFQAAGAGNYYLTNSGNFFNQGTTNIDPSLLTILKQRTTYPPILYSNVTVAINTTLNPQAQRDTDPPDLGYHYDPIDYLIDQYTITNALLTLTNGVAIASYNDSGIVPSDGSMVLSIGSPLYPNWFVRYSSVQEQPVALGSSGLSAAESFNPYHLTAADPGARFRFSKFACPAGGGTHLVDGPPGSPSFIYNNLLVQDCEFWSGKNTFSGGTNTVIILKNNLFARSPFLAGPISNYTNNSLILSNNLFWITSVTLLPSVNSNSNRWFVYNNSFDTCTNTTAAHGSQQFTMNDYNAYINCNQQLSPTNANNKVLTSAFTYQTGPLGTFYQTNTSPLINKGSVTANLVGLYHYTVTTNLVSNLEIKETNSIVDIGYHYVAVDINGNPIDTNGDGIPDYQEDANGNGFVDSGEIGWNITGDLGLKVIITRPRNGSILP